MLDPAHLQAADLELHLFKALFTYPDIGQQAPRIPQEVFHSPQVQQLFRLFCRYVQDFQEVPSITEFRAFLETQSEWRNIQEIATKILQTLSNLNPPAHDWIITEFDRLIKQQLYTGLIAEYHSYIARGRLRDFEQQMLKIAYGTPFQLQSFDNVFSAEQPSFLQQADIEFNFPTRIYALDDDIKGFFRKELVVILAFLNVGKSWFCVHTAQSALLEQKKVLWLTLEMSRSKVLRRLFQAFTGLVDDPTGEQLVEMEFSTPDGNSYINLIPTLSHAEQVQRDYEIIKQLIGSAVLVVREFPSLSITAEAIRGEILRFQGLYQTPPDLLIVDALTDVKAPRDRDRANYGQVARILRAYAQEFDMTVLATHQANRAALRADLIDASHTGEDIRIMQVADTGISLNQSRLERRQNQMRLYLMRARNAKKDEIYRIYQNFATGQFCLHSEKYVEEGTENG